jgi:hypothetical protein
VTAAAVHAVCLQRSTRSLSPVCSRRGPRGLSHRLAAAAVHCTRSFSVVHPADVGAARYGGLAARLRLLRRCRLACAAVYVVFLAGLPPPQSARSESVSRSPRGLSRRLAAVHPVSLIGLPPPLFLAGLPPPRSSRSVSMNHLEGFPRVAMNDGEHGTDDGS